METRFFFLQLRAIGTEQPANGTACGQEDIDIDIDKHMKTTSEKKTVIKTASMQQECKSK